jgi:hypothetical protein
VAAMLWRWLETFWVDRCNRAAKIR